MDWNGDMADKIGTNEYGEILIYQTDDGQTNIEVKIEEEEEAARKAAEEEAERIKKEKKEKSIFHRGFRFLKKFVEDSISEEE